MSESRSVHAFAPGRIEIAGNHTDHQGGRAITGTMATGIEMTLHANDTNVAHVESEGFAPVEIDAGSTAPREEERETTAALVRGMIALCKSAGVPVKGFDATVTSTLPIGGGLSSSAAFELALGRALDLLFGAVERPALELARMGQQCEAEWFGKPCGLLDQSAIAIGGVVALDFANAAQPEATPIAFDFATSGLIMCLLDTGIDHSAYTADYAAVPQDMCAAAQCCGQEALGKVPEETFLASVPTIRAQASDRAVLRGLHFYSEQRLVDQRRAALETGDLAAFLSATNASGESSAQRLQNLSRSGDASQPALLAYELVKVALHDARKAIAASRASNTPLAQCLGACRIHGGGFGGYIQAFVPSEQVGAFTARIEALLGCSACSTIPLGSKGATAWFL